MFLNDFVRWILLAFTLWGIYRANALREDEMVERWAGKLGDELWELGTIVTKSPDIRTSYSKLNARVLPTDGEGILQSILHNVGRLLKQKMDSLRCLIYNSENLAQNLTKEEVEYLADNFTYYHSIYSDYTGKYNITEEKSDQDESDEEEEEEEDVVKLYAKNMEKIHPYMDLEENNNFFGMEVNTSFSSVHVPYYVYDRGEDSIHSIMWSEGLDRDFVNNYESDSTITWQYFCSATGFLRHFPAYHWPEDTQNGFDCRTRIWFSQAATCPKQVVMMIDRSGSMIGVKKTLAKAVIETVLDSLSNNDFLNIYVFNKTVQHIVQCFPNETLVQATAENLQMFNTAFNETVYEDKIDLEPALIHALNILDNSRRDCPDLECSQVVFLILDGIADNVTHVLQDYFKSKNESSEFPAKLFIFMIGKDSGGADLAANMACINKGAYMSVKHLEEVREEVLKYIPHLSRPESEDVKNRTFSWAHMFVDATGIRKNEAENQYRMMTSVIAPAFHWNTNNSNQEKTATLLGVAGIDVLIEDIKKLTLPYKIGANGYAFLITNNGHLVFHPDHRPIEGDELKINFNSIDLTEVEFFDDNETEPRLPNERILELRDAMVLHEYGRMEEVSMKFHYDEMRRVGVESRHYYYAPLNNTPFSLGLVLPHSYGSYWIKAGDEIKKSIQMGVPLTDHFKGNWRIHPKWMYCDYHRADIQFSSPEEKLTHFLEKMFNIHDWKWKDQFEEYYNEDSDLSDCGEKVAIKENDYYCDKDLMQLLVFDAKVTENSFKDSEWSAKTRREEELVNQFGVSVRFVATQSGLTRWQPVPQHPYAGEFANGKFTTLEESWYKSAVLFHQTDPEAFVYSVPFDAGSQSDPVLTASYAIFPRDGGNEAPGSVVGFQMLHSVLVERFKDITSKVQSFDTMDTCASDVLDCYIIDSNGYIVVSEVSNDTGRFFGEFEGAVMETMVAKNIFRSIPIFDYQAICFPDTDKDSGVGFLQTPFDLMKQVGVWFLSRFLWIMISMNQWLPVYAQIDSDEDYESLLQTLEEKPKIVAPVLMRHIIEEEEEIIPEGCDKFATLYHLEPESEELPYTAVTNCSRPFYVKRIPKTNLLLIVVNTLYQSCYRKLSTDITRIEYQDEGYNNPGCHKLLFNSFTRRRTGPCFTTYPEDFEMAQCSGCKLTPFYVLAVVILHTLYNMQYFNGIH